MVFWIRLTGASAPANFQEDYFYGVCDVCKQGESSREHEDAWGLVNWPEVERQIFINVWLQISAFVPDQTRKALDGKAISDVLLRFLSYGGLWIMLKEN